MQLFINVGADPVEELKKRDNRALGLTNVFNYNGKRDHAVLNIETILTNSWGEIICKRFQGPISLLNCINDFMQSVPPDSDTNAPNLKIHCFCNTQAEATARRMQELFRDLTACYYTGTMPSNTRYILQMKDQMFIIQYENGKTQFKGARNVAELIKRLGQNQNEYSPVIFDRHALANSALAAICPTMSPNTVQVYFQDNGDKTATVYCIDEKGSVMSYSQPFLDPNSLLNPIDTFIQSTLYRQSASESIGNKGFGEGRYFIETQVLYYEIRYTSPEQPPKVLPYTLPSRLTAQHDSFSVQAIAELGPHNKPIFNIYCDQNEFSAADWGQGLYPAIARFILSRRKSGENYPCYVSDLDLSSMGLTTGSSNTQTIDYWRYKLEIDDAINDALQRQNI
jgi:adenylate cyclase class 1